MNSSQYDFAQPAEALLSIGEVLVRLRDEFADISISKIRFLETNGLVSPERTPSGYRKFSLVDVERLRYVLRMQRDHFLPLRVIKDHIDALNRGLEPANVTDVAPKPPRNLMSTSEIAISSVATNVRLKIDELALASKTDVDFCQDLCDFGLIKADAAGYFNGTAVGIVNGANGLRAFGLEPRHLKTVLSSASREVDLFTPIVKTAGAGKQAASRAEIEELSLQLASSIVSLHGLLVREILDRQT
ncbi:MAG: MerR family transcriptional regulator [Actinomycetes bacterium]